MKEMVGKKFSRLTVLSRADNTPAGKPRWNCECECGSEVVTGGYGLRSGNSKSCGCYQIERVKTHGLYEAREYGIWGAMFQRCNNPRNKIYVRYGGRGISVCESWANFENFISDMGPRPSTGHSLDRIDNDGNYCPSNCRWATRREQQNNTRRNVHITANGETMTIAQWARKISATPGKLWGRKARGWTDSEIINGRRK